MNDMSTTVIAKSDQINAADLVGISRTITVKEVRIKAGEDQPVTIMVEGDTKAFRPCKGVRRLLVRVWGPDANKYIGQSMTIYCDPTVTWAGKPEGGIRISHMTGLDEKIVEYMRTSREKTKPYTIEPLKIDAKPAAEDTAAKYAAAIIAKLAAFETIEAVDALVIEKVGKLSELQAKRPELHKEVMDAVAARKAELDTDPFAEDDTSPADAAAQSYIADFGQADSIDAIEALWTKSTDDRTAMPDALSQSVEAAYGEAKARLGAKVEA